MYVAFHDLITDEQTHTIHSMTAYGTALQVRFNSTRYLYNNFEDRQTMLDHHLFACFMVVPLNTTKNYIAFKASNGNPIMVITNGKPIFIPLTQAQYLNYQIAYDKDAANKFGADHEKDLKDLNDTKHYVASMSKEKAAAIGAGNLIKMKEKNTASDIKLKDLWNQRAYVHQQQLDALTPAEKHAPAYLSMKKGDDITFDLGTPGDPDAKELWTINPHYFNNALPLSAIQLITVTYHTVGEDEYIQNSVRRLQQQMNYKRLKALIQK